MTTTCDMLLFKLIERQGARGWRSILENARHMMGLFTRVLLCVFGRLTKGDCLAVYSMSRSIRLLYKKSGPLFTGMYLKQVSFLVMWYVGGEKGKTPVHKTAVSTTRSGIPRIIPPYYRKKLRMNDPVVIQIVLSLCTLSRLIMVLPKGGLRFNPLTVQDNSFDLHPVTSAMCDALQDASATMLAMYAPEFCQMPLKLGFDFKPMFSSSPCTILNPIKDSYVKGLSHVKDLSLTVFHVLPLEALNLIVWLDPEYYGRLGGMLFSDRDVYVDSLKGTNVPRDTTGEIAFCEFLLYLQRLATKLWKPECEPALGLGRLGRKLEGSGKVRIFAMPNPILQTLLRPLHDWVMSILRTLPMDGTFDQPAPLARLKGKRELFSFDLKSATDLLPAALSESLLYGLFGEELSQTWGDLMQTTVFRGPDRVAQNKSPRLFKFTRGQPLGYYSSWPVFTLTHHMLVWVCAWEVYPGKVFTDYAILGDDIVIADRRVAEEYEERMVACQAVISREKSLTSSKGACEFAKKFIINNHLKDRRDVSPLSLPLIRMTYGYVSPFVFKTLGCSVRATFRLRGGGYRVFSKVQGNRVVFGSLSRKWKRHWIALHSPSGLCALPIELLLGFPDKGILNCYEMGMVRRFLVERVCPKDIREDVFQTLRQFWEGDDLGYLDGILASYVKLHLEYLKWYATIICDHTCTLGTIMDPPVAPTGLDRPREDIILRYGLLFRAWDFVRTHKAPLVLCEPKQRVNRDFIYSWDSSPVDRELVMSRLKLRSQ